MNSPHLFKYGLIIIACFYLSGCYPTIYGIPQEYWGTLTEDQKRTAIEGYYEQERLRVLQDGLWQIERERQHARWRVEEAERRASDAEQRAREAEQKLREEEQSNDNNNRPSKRLGHGKVTK